MRVSSRSLVPLGRVLACAALADSATSLWIDRIRLSSWARRGFLLLSLVGNLGLLAYFKYSGLIFDTAVWVAQLFGRSPTERWSLLRVVLPAGISFYTFQTLSYVIDIYRGKNPPERNFFK